MPALLGMKMIAAFVRTPVTRVDVVDARVEFDAAGAATQPSFPVAWEEDDDEDEEAIDEEDDLDLGDEDEDFFDDDEDDDEVDGDEDDVGDDE